MATFLLALVVGSSGFLSELVPPLLVVRVGRGGCCDDDVLVSAGALDEETDGSSGWGRRGIPPCEWLSSPSGKLDCASMVLSDQTSEGQRAADGGGFASTMVTCFR